MVEDVFGRRGVEPRELKRSVARKSPSADTSASSSRCRLADDADRPLVTAELAELLCTSASSAAARVLQNIRAQLEPPRPVMPAFGGAIGGGRRRGRRRRSSRCARGATRRSVRTTSARRPTAAGRAAAGRSTRSTGRAATPCLLRYTRGQSPAARRRLLRAAHAAPARARPAARGRAAEAGAAGGRHRGAPRRGAARQVSGRLLRDHRQLRPPPPAEPQRHQPRRRVARRDDRPPAAGEAAVSGAWHADGAANPPNFIGAMRPPSTPTRTTPSSTHGSLSDYRRQIYSSKVESHFFYPSRARRAPPSSAWRRRLRHAALGRPCQLERLSPAWLLLGEQRVREPNSSTSSSSSSTPLSRSVRVPCSLPPSRRRRRGRPRPPRSCRRASACPCPTPGSAAAAAARRRGRA